MYTFYNPYHAGHATAAAVVEGQPFITEEVPARAELLLAAVREAGLGPVLPPVDHGLEPILAVHEADFVTHLRTAYAESVAYYGRPEPAVAWTFALRYSGPKPTTYFARLGYYAFGSGTIIVEGTWEAAYWSAQTALTAAEWLLQGERLAYALCRPPGHHAATDLYGGFCFLNNAAIAARWLQKAAPGPVAILDIDYHHGNGTQAIFYTDPTVLFCSLHADPDGEYPFYWGRADERGEGAGLGYNHNWPLPPQIGDAAYLAVLDEALATIRDFAPRHLVVSVGLDTAQGDPVGNFALTPAGFHAIGARIAGLRLPTLLVQEGGYLLERLGENAEAFLQGINAPAP
jgi:acetoin utilization deacetylase AcuC-like enzyme